MVKIPGSVVQTVSAVAVIDLANELVSRACLEKNYLKNMGADFNALFSAWKENRVIQEERLPEELLTQLWADAERSCSNDHIGLDIGYKVNNQARGLLANLLFQCSTLSEAFATFRKNIHLLNPSEYWERTNERDRVKLSFQFKSLHYPFIAVDRSMAAVISWSSALIGTEIKPISVSFTRPKPNSIDKYEKIFGKHIAFEQNENALVFPVSIFNQQIGEANPYFKELLERQASELSASLASNPSVTEKINVLFIKDLPRYCQIEEVCQVLHLSRSTLYRKLKSEETSFTKLVRDTRINKIHRMEKKFLNHDAIAEALGFNDSGSYYRFRKVNLVSN